MTFYAQMGSSLGGLLLCTDGANLTGVYFMGQKDCPVLDGLPQTLPESDSPSAGMLAGQALRKMRVSQQLPILPSEGVQALAASAASSDSDLRYMQASTPLIACAILQQTHAELREYFQGKRTHFNVPVETDGTGFQNKVWKLLMDIPYGQLRSYGEVASLAGLGTTHGRPVGTAVGRNPIAIIIPCHRVLSATGALTGYTGGLHRKLTLLELEGIILE